MYLDWAVMLLLVIFASVSLLRKLIWLLVVGVKGYFIRLVLMHIQIVFHLIIEGCYQSFFFRGMRGYLVWPSCFLFLFKMHKTLNFWNTLLNSWLGAGRNQKSKWLFDELKVLFKWRWLCFTISALISIARSKMLVKTASPGLWILC